MVVLNLVILVLCYGSAGYLAYRYRSPIFLFALLSGHLAALAAPLWQVLYGVSYSAELAEGLSLFGRSIPRDLILASGWIAPLPAMIGLVLYRERWWFPGFLTAAITLLVFLLYHLLIESIAARTSTWVFRLSTLPFGLPSLLLDALMAAMVSFGLFYTLLTSAKAGWLSLVFTVIPITLVLNLAIYGLVGAPIWLTRLLNGPEWAINFGMLATLGLLVGFGQIVAHGIANRR